MVQDQIEERELKQFLSLLPSREEGGVGGCYLTMTSCTVDVKHFY